MTAPAITVRTDLAVRVKYVLDRLMAAPLLVLLSPLAVAIAIAIRRGDGGPSLFVQWRPGLAGRPFRCYKFRTMLVDADRHVDAAGRPTRDRTTRLGKWLRRTSLDELPQLLNVLRGDMSLVGPRPPMMDHLLRYSTEQMQRFRMKPGLTGLAQIRGRNMLPWSKRIELDNEYIDNFSLWRDLTILLRTVSVVLRREGIAVDRNPEQVDDLPPKRDSATC